MAEATTVDAAKVTAEAHANAVKAAEKELADRRAAAASAALPVITFFHGNVRGPFSIRGKHLAGRDVRINGITPILAAAPQDEVIKGAVPFDIKAGDVVVTVGSATFKGKVFD